MSFGEHDPLLGRAAQICAETHVTYLDAPVSRVLSLVPTMYEDIWTGAKGFYKLEPVVADGGEVILYAPHITEISAMHPEIDEIGYHCRDYFVKQWDRFEHIHWGVLAHSTHLRGAGTYDADTGVERCGCRSRWPPASPRTSARRQSRLSRPRHGRRGGLRGRPRHLRRPATPARSCSGCAEPVEPRTTSLTGSTIGSRLGTAPPITAIRFVDAGHALRAQRCSHRREPRLDDLGRAMTLSKPTTLTSCGNPHAGAPQALA